MGGNRCSVTALHETMRPQEASWRCLHSILQLLSAATASPASLQAQCATQQSLSVAFGLMADQASLLLRRQLKGKHSSNCRDLGTGSRPPCAQEFKQPPGCRCRPSAAGIDPTRASASPAALPQVRTQPAPGPLPAHSLPPTRRHGALAPPCRRADQEACGGLLGGPC